MRIILDMDSILADLMTDWLGIYNKLHDDDLTLDRIMSWDTHLYAKAGKAVYEVLKTPGLYKNLKPLPGAVEATRTLAERHDVLVVTAAVEPVNFSEKAEWFNEYLPFLSKHQFMIGHKKYRIEADALVDDGPHNAEAYRVAHPGAKILTIGYNYNIGNPAYDVVAGDWRDTASAWKKILEELP